MEPSSNARKILLHSKLLAVSDEIQKLGKDASSSSGCTYQHMQFGNLRVAKALVLLLV